MNVKKNNKESNKNCHRNITQEIYPRLKESDENINSITKQVLHNKNKKTRV